jgi:hypothetical protein
MILDAKLVVLRCEEKQLLTSAEPCLRSTYYAKRQLLLLFN